jgi:hypothetical protein
MRTLLVASLAAVLATPALAQTAAKPSFAGKWIQVVDSTAPTTGGRAGRGLGALIGLGPEATIVQDSAKLSVTRAVPQVGEMKSDYKLDGTDTPAQLDFQGYAIPTISNARWEGEKLTLTTRVDFNGTALSSSATLSLEAGTLVVTTNVPSATGGAATTTTAKYKKG